MVDEATKGNMPNGVFHSRVWNSMTIRLNSLTKRSYKSPQLKAKMHRSTATGVLHHSSNQDPPNTDEENELESQYLNVGSRVDVDNDSSDDDIHEVERTTRSGKRSSQMNDPKSKKKCRSNDMGEALSAWAEASKAKAEQYKVTSSRMSDHSITKCVTALEEIEDVPDDVYMKALEKVYGA
ncbi:Myb/SANT-like DNA-binding domain protein [Sesbania bispinosa]|nr:Myb/SANT-like DNA-binding domain protein [Sesbania bispinosa]